ncbi:MAG TPA: DUF5719 family protein [Acidimicrobiia bacterium]|nr:DUF5719 family protein [Acidimicrobiia bacterium]
MKYLGVVVMLVAAVAATFLPAPDPADPGAVPATEAPPVAICPILQAGERSTSVSVLSSVNGEGRLSTFAAGSETGALDFRTGRLGAVTIAAADVGAVGNAGGLVEMPSETTAAAVVVAGPNSRAAESCADIPEGQIFISGGSTAGGELFAIQLINPYAGEAIVNLTVTTDTGLESNDQFNAVVVPPLSTITRDMNEIIPGRETISANIETTRGSVLAYGRLTSDGEVAVWRAVAPGDNWWLPVPEGAGTKQMVIATPENSEIEYQVDLFGPDGYVEGHDTGVIAPRGRVVVPLAAVTEGAAGVRVITTGPVVPALRIDSPHGLAWTTASPVDATVWLLPGAGAPPEGSGSVVVLNTGIETVTVSIRALGESGPVRELEVDAEGVLVADLVAADGYRVEASGPVVALWTSEFGASRSAAIGIPLQDG